eukprot:CAMPEP_0171130562 /NCGR_PEP_ID=MMETSP0766_2-20121228/121143_1 /TAXON_ID=439317 /ORGANISM="Gambierdiscus australes, Strain CAWD 149" /LENGTH=59 /DNA_ID=CAMNT_0011593815 /DNA_START=428 /DNA_END=607 /DNA_ORIENTATION=-
MSHCTEVFAESRQFTMTSKRPTSATHATKAIPHLTRTSATPLRGAKALLMTAHTKKTEG